MDIIEAIFKKYISITIDDEPFMDGTYMVTLTVDDDDPWDYVHIFVTKEEKDILEEWLKN